MDCSSPRAIGVGMERDAGGWRGVAAVLNSGVVGRGVVGGWRKEERVCIDRQTNRKK